MDYISASQAAKLWNISQRRVQILCAEGRVSGAFKIGEVWAIPSGICKPTDKRRKATCESEKI